MRRPATKLLKKAATPICPPDALAARVPLDPGEAERVREALAASACMSFDVTHVSRLSAALGEARDAQVILLEVGGRGPDRLANLFQARLRAPELPVVVLSDLDDEELAHKALQSGARGYLTKSEANTRLRERQFVGAVLVSDTESWVYKGRAHAYGSHGSTGVMTEWQQFAANQQRLGGTRPKLTCIEGSTSPKVSRANRTCSITSAGVPTNATLPSISFSGVCDRTAATSRS